MIRTQYSLTTFDQSKAQSGSLCVMVSAGLNIPSTIYNFNNTPGDNNSLFKGAGIAKYRTNGSKFEFAIDGVSYLFTSSGSASSEETGGWKLVMGKIIETVSTSGNATTGTNTGHATRGSDGSITQGATTYGDRTITIDSVNARDQFAMEALNSIILKMEYEPTSLNDDTISHLCQQAYRYAACMMTASANARGTFKDETEKTTDASAAAVGELETNTDKLLNNLIVALERTQNKITENNKDIYSQRVDFKGLDDIVSRMEDNNIVITALKDNVTNAMTNMQQVMTQQLGAFNQIVAKLDLINSSIQSFTQNMNDRFQGVNSNISSIGTKVDSMQNTTSDIDTKFTSLQAKTNTIDTNVKAVKDDVQVIKINTTPVS